MTTAKHVLLIDDDTVQLQLREQVLRHAGFSTATAADGEAALAVLRDVAQPRVDAIVTDHLLPGLGGAELVRRIRALRPDVPILVITGLLDAEPEYTGLDIAFRPKPVLAAELIAALRSVTQRTS